MGRNVKKRKRKEKTPEQKAKALRRSSVPRHVVPYLELEPGCDEERRLLHQMKGAAWVKRRVRAHYRKALGQLRRDRFWHILRQSYHDSSDALAKAKKSLSKLEGEKERAKGDPAALNTLRREISEIKARIKGLEAEKKGIGEDLSALQERYRVTFDAGREVAAHYSKQAGIHSMFGLGIAEDVWGGVEKILYSDGRKLSSAYEDFCALRAKQPERGIVIKEKDGRLIFKIDGIGTIAMKEPDADDLWLASEVAAIASFIHGKGAAEDAAVRHLLETGEILNVARPCYATVFVQQIRGRYRFYANVTVEGEPFPKLRADGSPRHEFADDGEIGCDIGPSSYAAVGEGFVEMSNLAVRGEDKWKKQEQRKAELQRRMSRSLMVNNPGNYDAKGNIKPGKKRWVRSKSYERCRSQYRDLCRKQAANREYALREQVNRLRCHGAVLITENQSIASWAKKTKEVTTRKTRSGKIKNNPRQRMGGSIQRFAPGMFTDICKEKFGDGFVQVDIMFRASQYDHERDTYEKKPLSQRMHHHAQGRASPRDLYSAFLLWCAAAGYEAPDQELCNDRFEDYYLLVQSMVADYRERGVKVRNSGLFER